MILRKVRRVLLTRGCSSVRFEEMLCNFSNIIMYMRIVYVKVDCFLYKLYMRIALYVGSFSRKVGHSGNW